MEFIVDPTLHIIDTQTDFILTTKKINLSFNLGSAERIKVYAMLDKLRKGRSAPNEWDDRGAFEAKLFKLLLNKGVIWERELEEEVVRLPFNQIYAPRKFLEVLNKNLGFAFEWKDKSDQSRTTNAYDTWHLQLLDESAADHSVYVYIFEDCFYLSSTNSWRTSTRTFSELHLEHAAYVFIDKLKKKELDQLCTDVLRIDLSIYNNDIQRLVTENIDEDHLLESIVAAEHLTGNKLKLDYEQFFPLVHAQIELAEAQKVLYSFGFDQRDALRNLLFILKNEEMGNIVKHSTSYKKEFELDKDSFLLKFMNIYFNQEELSIQSSDEGKKIICEGVTYTLTDGACSKNSLFLSVYFNQRMGNKGALSYGNEVLRA